MLTRTAIVEGGIEALAATKFDKGSFTLISRDALALVLGLVPSVTNVPHDALVVDLRRTDERLLYGTIRGTVHLPGVTL